MAGSREVSEFIAQLNCYKELIDTRIEGYMPLLKSQVAEQFGALPEEAFEPFASYMLRGGKRIRGALTVLGYEMFGGKNLTMIVDAAMAIEMLQSYLLMMDDIQDRSEIRRGGPTAHEMMTNYHKKHHLRGDANHFGESIAMNSYLVGCHTALELITSLDVNAKILIRALKNVHKSYVITAHGQTLDIFSEVSDDITERDINNILLWKTAYYTFVNPLQFGAILAGADESDLTLLYKYAIPAGKAFQLTDDILGIFGNEFESGKSPMDDIKDGKRTLLVMKALEKSPKAEAYFLRRCLGKRDLNIDEFNECKKIIKLSGAKKYTENLAHNYIGEASEVLSSIGADLSERHLAFLKGLVFYLVERKS